MGATPVKLSTIWSNGQPKSGQNLNFEVREIGRQVFPQLSPNPLTHGPPGTQSVVSLRDAAGESILVASW